MNFDGVLVFWCIKFGTRGATGGLNRRFSKTHSFIYCRFLFISDSPVEKGAFFDRKWPIGSRKAPFSTLRRNSIQHRTHSCTHIKKHNKYKTNQLNPHIKSLLFIISYSDLYLICEVLIYLLQRTALFGVYFNAASSNWTPLLHIIFRAMNNYLLRSFCMKIYG